MRKRNFGRYGCPYCTSDDYQANKDGLEDSFKYRCNSCKRKFNSFIKRGKVVKR